MSQCLCPTCGQTIRRPPSVEGLKDISFGPVQLAIVTKLVSMYPHGVSRDRLIAHIWEDDPEGGPLSPRNCVSVAIINLRRKLGPLGWTIASSAKSGAAQTIYTLREGRP